MALKWASALIAVAAMVAFGTANIVTAAVSAASVPAAVNLVLMALFTGSAALVVVAELYQRLDARLGVVSEFLVTRLDEIVGRLDDLEARVPDRGLEAFLGTAEASVVPMPSRPARARRAPADD
jgi:hypothetical protein